MIFPKLKFNLFEKIILWLFGFIFLFSFDLFMEGVIFELLDWNGTEKNDWFFVLWWGLNLLWFGFGISNLFFHLKTNRVERS